MSRVFAGGTDLITLDVAAGPPAMNDALTILALVKITNTNDTAWQSIAEFERADGTVQAYIGRDGSGRLAFINTVAVSFGVAGGEIHDGLGWAWLAVSRSAGGVTTAYIRPVGSASGTFTNSAVADGQAMNAGGRIKLGGDDDPFIGKLAVFAYHPTAEIAPATIDTFDSTQDVIDAGFITYDAANGFATPHSAAGGARTAIVGTTDDPADNPAGFTYFGASPYIGSGAAASAASGNVTATLPTSLQTNDILVLDVIAADNVNCAAAPSGGSGTSWTRIRGYSHPTAGALRKEVWWKRRGAADTDTTVTVTHAAGGPIIAQAHAFRVPNAPTTGDPFEDNEVLNVDAASSGSFPSIIALTSNLHLLYSLGYARDFTTGPSIVNAQGLTLTERAEAEITGVSQAVYTADRATTGTQAGPTWTITPNGANAVAISWVGSIKTTGAGVAPSNTAAPVASGTPASGQTLSVTTGTWTGDATITYTYQWQRNGVNISGATTNTYVLVEADEGNPIRCVVTATNSSGSASANSNAITLLDEPVISSAPAITGTSETGETLTCSTGTWTNTPSSYAYQWKRNNVNIGGATSSTYLLAVADEGQSIKCTVTATNVAGSTAADSNTVTPTAATPDPDILIRIAGSWTGGDMKTRVSGSWV